MKDLSSRVAAFARTKSRDENGKEINLYPKHNYGRYARDAFTDVCANCYLPACYSDEDFKDECKKAGITAKTEYCPIVLMIKHGLTIPQTTQITAIALEASYSPEKVTAMAIAWGERNKLYETHNSKRTEFTKAQQQG